MNKLLLLLYRMSLVQWGYLVKEAIGNQPSTGTIHAKRLNKRRRVCRDELICSSPVNAFSDKLTNGK